MERSLIDRYSNKIQAIDILYVINNNPRAARVYANIMNRAFNNWSTQQEKKGNSVHPTPSHNKSHEQTAKYRAI